MSLQQKTLPPQAHAVLGFLINQAERGVRSIQLKDFETVTKSPGSRSYIVDCLLRENYITRHREGRSTFVSVLITREEYDQIEVKSKVGCNKTAGADYVSMKSFSGRIKNKSGACPYRARRYEDVSPTILRHELIGAALLPSRQMQQTMGGVAGYGGGA